MIGRPSLPHSEVLKALPLTNLASFPRVNEFDFILYNSKMIGKKLLAKLAFDAEKIRDAKPIDDRRFIGGDFLDLAIPILSPHDPMKRPLVRHHPGKIGRQIFKLMK